MGFIDYVIDSHYIKQPPTNALVKLGYYFLWLIKYYAIYVKQLVAISGGAAEWTGTRNSAFSSAKNEEKLCSTYLLNPFFGWFQVPENRISGTRSSIR